MTTSLMRTQLFNWLPSPMTQPSPAMQLFMTTQSDTVQPVPSRQLLCSDDAAAGRRHDNGRYTLALIGRRQRQPQGGTHNYHCNHFWTNVRVMRGQGVRGVMGRVRISKEISLYRATLLDRRQNKPPAGITIAWHRIMSSLHGTVWTAKGRPTNESQLRNPNITAELLNNAVPYAVQRSCGNLTRGSR